MLDETWIKIAIGVIVAIGWIVKTYQENKAKSDAGKPPAKCTDPKQMGALFPIALRAFLVQTGYLAAEDSATR